MKQSRADRICCLAPGLPCLLTLFAAASVASLVKDPPPAPSAEEVRQSLETFMVSIAPTLEESDDVRRAISYAGEMGDKTLLPIVEAIFNRYKDDQSRNSIASRAMYAMKSLGKENAFFIPLALGYKSNTALAGSAITILARDPYDPDAVATVKQVDAAVRNTGSWLQGPLNSALGVRDLAKRYKRLWRPEDKCKLLMQQNILARRRAEAGRIPPR